jgi:hypothetical protein
VGCVVVECGVVQLCMLAIDARYLPNSQCSGAAEAGSMVFAYATKMVGWCSCREALGRKV